MQTHPGLCHFMYELGGSLNLCSGKVPWCTLYLEQYMYFSFSFRIDINKTLPHHKNTHSQGDSGTLRLGRKGSSPRTEPGGTAPDPPLPRTTSLCQY